MSETLYHGSKGYCGPLDPEKSVTGIGVWFTKNKRVAETNINEMGCLYEAKVDISRPYHCELSEYQQKHQPKGRQWRAELIDQNYDGVIMDNLEDTYYIPLYSCQITVVQKIEVFNG